MNIFEKGLSVDYAADYNEAQSAGHHIDCDGYVTVHRTEVVRTRFGTWETRCEECGVLHIGSFGSRESAEAQGKGHAQEIRCDKRCLAWD